MGWFICIIWKNWSLKVKCYQHEVLSEEYTQQNTNKRKQPFFLLTMGRTSCISSPNNHSRWQTAPWTEWGSNLHEKILENVLLAEHYKMQTKEEILLSRSRRVEGVHHLYQAERKWRKAVIKEKYFPTRFSLVSHCIFSCCLLLRAALWSVSHPVLTTQRKQRKYY